VLQRAIEGQLLEQLVPNKVMVLMGPRRVGKTVLLQQLTQKIDEPILLLNGEDITVMEQLERRSVVHYRQLLGNYQLLIIDEAQKIPEIGKILKLMVDEIAGLKIIVTGSSAFDMISYTGEPLTGRKKTFYLFPLAESELSKIESPFEHKDRLYHRLIYGNYPELLHLSGRAAHADYLNDLVNSYLLRDILAYERIRDASKITQLLRLIAFQVGNEVSYNELANQLELSKNTVERYLDLLNKVFVIFSLGGFSKNLRKEVTKNKKWYFYDNGIRNAVIANFNAIHIRDDQGALWENYVISERLKYQYYNRMIVNNFFWRTYDRQEIDWIEERGGKLYGFEMKWNPKKQQIKAPKAWLNTYPEASFEVIHPENYREWVI